MRPIGKPPIVGLAVLATIALGALQAVAQAVSPPTAGLPMDEVSSYWTRELIKNGSFGVVFAGTLFLALKWTGTELLRAKDGEIARQKDALVASTAAVSRLAREIRLYRRALVRHASGVPASAHDPDLDLDTEDEVPA